MPAAAPDSTYRMPSGIWSNRYVRSMTGLSLPASMSSFRASRSSRLTSARNAPAGRLPSRVVMTAPSDPRDRPDPLARLRRDHHDPPRRSQGPPHRGEAPVPTHVEDQVVARASAGEVVPGVVDHLARSDRTRHLDVLRARDGRDLGAERRPDLHGERSDPAPGAVHEHPLAGDEAPMVAQSLERGHPRRRNGGRFLEGESGRHRHHVLAAEVFGKRAEPRAVDRIARPDVGHVGADLFGDPGDVEAEVPLLRPPEPLGEACEVRLAAKHVPVMGVERSGSNAHEDRVVAGQLRLVDLLEPENVGGSVSVLDECLHRFLRTL